MVLLDFSQTNKYRRSEKTWHISDQLTLLTPPQLSLLTDNKHYSIISYNEELHSSFTKDQLSESEHYHSRMPVNNCVDVHCFCIRTLLFKYPVTFVLSFCVTVMG